MTSELKDTYLAVFQRECDPPQKILLQETMVHQQMCVAFCFRQHRTSESNFFSDLVFKLRIFPFSVF